MGRATSRIVPMSYHGLQYDSWALVGGPALTTDYNLGFDPPTITARHPESGPSAGHCHHSAALERNNTTLRA